MNLNQYQERAHKTALYKRKHMMKVYVSEYFITVPMYPFLKVITESAEMGEDIIKSELRGDKKLIYQSSLIDEIGDIMWYCAEMATQLGVTLESIGQKNLIKLANRASQHKIKDHD